jgi:hypothetical protein
LPAKKLLENVSRRSDLQKRRNSPADKWLVLPVLAKGESGDLLDKWACGMKLKIMPPIALLTEAIRGVDITERKRLEQESSP